MFQIIRSCVLLSVLILLPATAVCWNMIPNDIFQKNEKIEPATENDPTTTNANLVEQPNNLQPPITEKNIKNNNPESAWLASSIPLSADPLINNSADPVAGKNGVGETPSGNNVPLFPPDFPSSASPLEQHRSSDQNMSPDQRGESDLVSFLPMTPLASGSSAASGTVGGVVGTVAGNQRGFSEIVNELKQLGATSYCLEIWGNQGELFRFRCYVNLHANNVDDNNQTNNYKYQKLFQHIDNDQIHAMEHVISEIKKWKSLQ
jgi:hypothetical protein